MYKSYFVYIYKKVSLRCSTRRDVSISTNSHWDIWNSSASRQWPRLSSGPPVLRPDVSRCGSVGFVGQPGWTDAWWPVVYIWRHKICYHFELSNHLNLKHNLYFLRKSTSRYITHLPTTISSIKNQIKASGSANHFSRNYIHRWCKLSTYWRYCVRTTLIKWIVIVKIFIDHNLHTIPS